MRRTRCVALAAVAALCTACIQPASLSVLPQAPLVLRYKPQPRALQLLPIKDLRPKEEIEGESPAMKYFIFAAIFMVMGQRGTAVTGKDHFVPEAWAQLQHSLGEHMKSTGLFTRVDGAPGADFQLETEVLHLLAGQYHTGLGFATLGGSFTQTRTYLPHATATLRLRLRNARGEVIGERVVNGTFLGDTRYTRFNLGQVARDALHNALRHARAQVASWVIGQHYESVSADAIKAHYDQLDARGHSFLVHYVNEDRSKVIFAEIDCPSGRLVRSHEASGIPIVGQPQQWLVSPTDAFGVRYHHADYDALTRHLAQHFILHRLDQISTYHFLGKRGSTVPTPAPPHARLVPHAH